MMMVTMMMTMIMVTMMMMMIMVTMMMLVIMVTMMMLMIMSTFLATWTRSPQKLASPASGKAVGEPIVRGLQDQC